MTASRMGLLAFLFGLAAAPPIDPRRFITMPSLPRGSKRSGAAAIQRAAKKRRHLRARQSKRRA